MAAFSQNANKCVPVLPNFILRDIGLRLRPIPATGYCVGNMRYAHSRVSSQCVLAVPSERCSWDSIYSRWRESSQANNATIKAKYF